MRWSPPKKGTVIISLLLEIIGIICGIIGYLALAPLYEGLDLNPIIFYLGLGLTFFAWLLMFIGVKYKGI